MTKENAVFLNHVSKYYEEGDSRLKILEEVTAEFKAGKLSVVYGKSGSGKSTLLNLISGIDTPSGGEIWIGENNLTDLTETERTIFRRTKIGLVFQFFNLIPTLSVLENVTLPLELIGTNMNSSKERAMELLERVGLTDRSKTMPDKLSGGEQQRIAIVRSLIHDPGIVLADEPTGNLDSDTGKDVLNLLIELTTEKNKTLVMATHSSEILARADNISRIHGGKLIPLTDQEILSSEIR